MLLSFSFFFFKQKTAYEMRISDWSSDVCSSDLLEVHAADEAFPATAGWHPWFRRRLELGGDLEVDMQATRFYPRDSDGLPLGPLDPPPPHGPWDDCFTGLTWPIGLTWPGALSLSLTSTCDRSEEHTSELQSLMRISYAVFCLKKKNT